MRHSSEGPEMQRSLAARLAELYGSDIDPRISLSDAARTAEASTAPSRPSAAESRDALERLGSHAPIVSRYRLEKSIARGGMGEIFEVWDQELRRNLAMKVVRTPNADAVVPPRMLARFLEEAQITGQLDHPGVVPVHELGLDAEGRVFFTMQLVRGRDLERIFELVSDEREGWTMTRAIHVLLKACEAVAYAHAKGVLHRDLKPANIMVGHFGEVYVMDWGLARVRGREDTATESLDTMRHDDVADESRHELFTMVGDIIGTPAYMAPEQATGKVGEADERADVYAFGAMLYRLLTGVAPYDAPGEKQSAGHIVLALRERAPRPVESLAPRVSPELVAICEKAMSRLPGDRYASMLELAEDLRSFLDNRVVSAYETGAVAETRKWVRRNKPLASALAATLIALATGLAAAWVLKGQADAHARTADLQASITAEVNDFLNRDLLAAAAPGARGANVTIREVLEGAALELDGKFPDRPLIEAELRTTIGKTFEGLGEYARSLPHLERAWQLRRDALGDRSERTLISQAHYSVAFARAGQLDEGHRRMLEVVGEMTRTLGEDAPATLAARTDLALTESMLGNYEKARQRYEAVLETQTRLLGETHPDTLLTLENVGIAYQNQGRYEEANERLRAVLAARRRLDGPKDPASVNSLINVALNSAQAGDLAESEALFDEALDLVREIFGTDHPEYATALLNLGVLRTAQGRHDDADRVTREAVEIARRTVGENHPNFFTALSNLIYLQETRGQFDEALPARRQLIEKQRATLGANHLETLRSESNLAMTLLHVGQVDEAETRLRDVCQRFIVELGSDHPDALVARENLGNVMYRKGDPQQAYSLTREVLAGRKRTFGTDHPLVARTQMNLATLEQSFGRRDEAIENMRGALERFRSGLGTAHFDSVRCSLLLGEALSQQGDHRGALDVYEETLAALRDHDGESFQLGAMLYAAALCHHELGDEASAIAGLESALEVRRATEGPGAPGTLATLDTMSTLLVATGRYAEAEPLLLDLHEKRLESLGRRHRETRAARARLIELYESWDRPEDAASWRGR